MQASLETKRYEQPEGGGPHPSSKLTVAAAMGKLVRISFFGTTVKNLNLK